jgi:hypothetical protein
VAIPRSYARQPHPPWWLTCPTGNAFLPTTVAPPQVVGSPARRRFARHAPPADLHLAACASPVRAPW